MDDNFVAGMLYGELRMLKKQRTARVKAGMPVAEFDVRIRALKRVLGLPV